MTGDHASSSGGAPGQAGPAHALRTERLQLEPHPSSPSHARRFVSAALDDLEAGELDDIVSLLVSELVTNAVLYGDGPIELVVQMVAAVLRIEVGDCSAAKPQPRHVDSDATSGRGLALVEALASRWGSYAVAGGKRVWFEIDI